MPLTAFFSEQLDRIEDFLDAPTPAVRIVLIDPEMRGILLRMLGGLDEQDDFLVLSGQCLLLIEGQGRTLKAGDFVHCPPWTEHVFVGAGEGPCALLAVGTRSDGGVIYPASELAQPLRIF